MCSISLQVAAAAPRGGSIVYIEPYYGGSHKGFVDLLQAEFSGDLYTLPPSKWNWRMRLSALHFSECIPRDRQYKSVGMTLLMY